MRICLLLLLATVFAVSLATPVAAVKFNGSDIGLGVGVEGVAMGGAFVALADDLTALYWNPAGLVETGPIGISYCLACPGAIVIGGEGSVAITNDWLLDFVAIGGSFEGSLGKFGWAVGYNRRLRFAIENIADFDPADWLYLMPVPTGFDGAIHATSDSYRLAVALTPAAWDRLSVGLAVESLTGSITHDAVDPADDLDADLTGIVADLGFRYRFSDRITLGLKLGGIYGDLTSTETSGGATTAENFAIHHDYGLSVAYRGGAWTWAVDYQVLSGTIPLVGEADIQLLHLGAAYQLNEALSLRGGLIVVAAASTADNPDLYDDLPAKIYSASFGVGYSRAGMMYEFALAVNPALSLYADGIVICPVFSASSSF